MNRKLAITVKIILWMSFLSIASSPPALFADYFYVDIQANGGNNGSSWTNAWESFADISWGSVSGGDVIYISGGSTSKTYYETLDVAANGSSTSSMIRIDVGANSPSPSGHDGQVRIDGQSSRAIGIDINGYNYIHVYGKDSSNNYKLYLTGHTGTGVGSVLMKNCSYVYIDYVEINNAESRGVFFENADHCRLRGSDIRTGIVSGSSQTDGVYMQFGSDNTLEYNTIILGINTPSAHVDCIQTANQESRLTIRGNYLEWIDGRGNEHCQTFITEDSTDWVYFYNNVVIGCSEHPYITALFKSPDPGGIYYIWNNIFVAQHPTGNVVQLFGADNQLGEFKNNIMYAPNGILLDAGTAFSSSKIDYNLYYRASGTTISDLGGSKSWASHQAAGYDSHGINVDPEYDTGNEYRPLDITAPTIGAGTTISEFNTDRDGNTRTAPWSIGAYGGIAVNPDPPKNFRRSPDN